MATKKQRDIVFNKYAGKCTYCGCDLVKGWHVDHIEPIIRNKYFDNDKRKWIDDGCQNPELDTIHNMTPSCASCNINKHQMDIEEFRDFIKGFLRSLNLRSVQYKFVKKYGLIEETEKPVVFYFETLR